MNFKTKLPLFLLLTGLSLAANASDSCAVNLHNSKGEVTNTFENFEDQACAKAHESCLEKVSEDRINGIDATSCSDSLSMQMNVQNRRPNQPSRPTHPSRPQEPSYPSYPDYPSYPPSRPGNPGYPAPPQRNISCTTDLLDYYNRVVRSYTELARTRYEACQRTESICNSELYRRTTAGVRCITRNGAPIPTPPPQRRITESCRVDRVDRFTGLNISQRYNATHTGYQYDNVKQVACQMAMSQCRRDEKIHQICVVKG